MRKIVASLAVALFACFAIPTLAGAEEGKKAPAKAKGGKKVKKEKKEGDEGGEKVEKKAPPKGKGGKKVKKEKKEDAE